MIGDVIGDVVRDVVGDVIRDVIGVLVCVWLNHRDAAKCDGVLLRICDGDVTLM